MLHFACITDRFCIGHVNIDPSWPQQHAVPPQGNHVMVDLKIFRLFPSLPINLPVSAGEDINFSGPLHSPCARRKSLGAKRWNLPRHVLHPLVPPTPPSFSHGESTRQSQIGNVTKRSRRTISALSHDSTVSSLWRAPLVTNM
jgi:hypothetical protein